eukprot:CAMPEP_0184499590 /NCGR_PEP_ID=MMETSP0113_2-20130426/41893_1 /TAXON_ID=91329 /ORGANISM="Norrisiella sphaerica, Strain BC52" /LENGTH=36 /DNA_ID= /DNA_START= /DNA_END= /DNA_ORIENTATION=
MPAPHKGTGEEETAAWAREDNASRVACSVEATLEGD